MTKRRATILVGLAVFALPVLYCFVKLATPAAMWLGYGLRVELGNYKDFVVTGTVVTQDGVPLDGTTVKVQRRRKRNMGFESDADSKYMKVGTSFEIRAENCDALNLYFLQEGYEVETVGFKKGGVHKDVRVVMKQKKVE